MSASLEGFASSERDGTGDIVPVMVDLMYSMGDPLAIEMEIACEVEDSVQLWVFGRDLLYSGLFLPMGFDQVLVEPGCELLAITIINSETRSEVTIRLEKQEVRSFLMRTFSLVPSWKESELLNIDQELESLLNG
jgi:hypothetical protein